MNIQNLVAIPEAMHEKAGTAIAATFGSAQVTVTGPLLGGASGAQAFKLNVAARDYVLRIEGKKNPLRNPQQYTCMRIAAEAGLAPPLHYVDDPGGVVIIDFIKQQPIAAYPGGPTALAAALGIFARNLQSTPVFPVLGDYRVGIERVFGYLRQSFAPGLLEPFIDGLARIRAVYPWDAATHVSSHNDPNPRNILFDGEKLWLIDWETSYRNDAFIDVAVLAENFANTPELEALLLKSWSGSAPTAEMRTHLLLARLLTRLYYAGLLALISAAAHAPVQDLSAPTPDEFKALLVSGKLSPTDSNTLLMLSKMQLANFQTGMASAEAQAALTAFG